MKPIVRTVAVLAAFAALALPAAAQGALRVEADVGVPFGLRIGGEAILGDTGLLVRFDRVTGDSRCPADVVCVWAGLFSMALVVTSADGVLPVETEVVLDTLGREGDGAGLRFTLLGVKPARSAARPQDEMPYAVLIRADRLQ